MVRIFTLAAALALLAACSRSDPEPTPDRPRLTPDEAKSAIYQAAREQSRPSLGCSTNTIRYRGDGVWECGKWTYDEDAGKAVLVR